jgi:hypothetical protein
LKSFEKQRGPEAFASGPRHENRSAHVLADSSSAKTASNFGTALSVQLSLGLHRAPVAFYAGEPLVARPAVVAFDVSAS